MSDPINLHCNHCDQDVTVEFGAPDPGEEHGVLMTPLSGDRHDCPAIAAGLAEQARLLAEEEAQRASEAASAPVPAAIHDAETTADPEGE